MIMYRSCLTVVAICAVVVASAAATPTVSGIQHASPALRGAVDDDDGTPDPTKLIHSYGYSATYAMVETADGYSLSLVHMPATTASTVGVVYLQHGLMDSSDTWLLNGPGVSLAFILADAGFSVYLGNCRGNQFSPTSDYDWNFDQMAEYDLPAFFDAIARSESSAPIYIGHSQGSAILFAALSTGWISPEQVSLFVALAPPVSLAHQRSILFQAMADLGGDVILKLLGSRAFLPTLSFVNKILGQDYTDEYQVLSALFGPSNNLGDSQWQGHFPEPTSAQNVGHWIQEARYGDFMHYKSSIFSPIKKYYISDIPQQSLPVAVLYGSNDYMADPTDVQALSEQLNELGDLLLVQEIAGYGHMDFTWAPNARSVLYPTVLVRCHDYANRTISV